MAFGFEKEVEEAIRAGETALVSLKEAQGYLNSAGNWGLVDIFGGGFITNFMKHSKLNKSRQCMENARQDLRRFRMELDDVDDYLPNIEVGEFLTFADFFFDGFVADIFVQSKIGDAKKQVADAIWQVTSIVNRLKNELGRY